MANEDMIRKITALLAKAESTQYEAEADAFIAKAQELMMRHAVDEAMLRAAGNKSKEEIVKREVQIRKRFKNTQGSFLSGLARLLNCRVYYSDIGSRLPYTIVGFESDAVFVEVLFESIRAQGNAARLHAGIALRKRVDCHDCGGDKVYPEYLGGGPCDTCKGRGYIQGGQVLQVNSFLEGYFNRVLSRCTARYRKMEEEAGSSVALALRDKGKDVDDWINERMQLRTARARRARDLDYGAYTKGREAGDRTDISGGRGHLQDDRKELT